MEELASSGDAAVLGQIGLTPRGKLVIDKGVAEARKLGHRFIGTEHLLLGLLQVPEGIGYRILQRCADIAAISTHTLALIADATRKSHAWSP